MKYETEILELMKKNNGIITTKEIEKKGIHRDNLSKLYKKDAIDKIAQGLYILKDVLIDEYYIYQLKHPEVIFSHDSALYFHDMTERTPENIVVTVPQGYYDKKKPDNIQLHYVKKEILNMGVIETKTNFGNIIRIYDVERTICDIIKKQEQFDPEQWGKTMRNYFFHSKVDYEKLIRYANKMGIYKKVEPYIGVSV